MELYLLLTLLSCLVCSGFWGHASQLRTEFERDLGGSWRIAGLDSASWRIEGGKHLMSELVWSELMLPSLGRWVSHCKHTLHEKSQKEVTFVINSCGLLSRNKRNKWQTSYTWTVAGLNYLKVWKERINFFHLQFKTQCFLMYVDFVKIIFLCSS